MRRGFGLALTAFALWAGVAPAAQVAGEAEWLGTYVWREDDRTFGGISGIDLAADGVSFLAMSDRTRLWQGVLARDADGRVTGVSVTGRDWLLGPDGQRLRGKLDDSEGLALEPGGGFFVSFEGAARVWHYPGFGLPADEVAEGVAGPRDFQSFPGNEGLEALAVDPAGVIYTVPERAMLRGRAFPVYRRIGAQWDRPMALPAADGWLPVGADVGPDGLLYLLERDFRGILGFRSRVLRFDPATGSAPEMLLETSPGTLDNLESIAVWRDDAGAIRLTMISDDNFSPLQQTQIVDYRLPE